MEKSVKGLHSELEGSWLKPKLLVTLGSSKYQVCLGDLAVRGNFVFCLIVVIFIGLGRAYRLGGF